MQCRVLMTAVALSAVTLASLLSPKATSAGGKDVHYDLKYTLALEAGYSADDAKKIASADQAQDSDSPEARLGSENNKKWHAFGTPEENQARLKELEKAVDDETDHDKKLAKLGQYLHFLEDIYFHEGYHWYFGHGWASFWSWFGLAKDPDSMDKDPEKTKEMIRQSLEALRKTAKSMGLNPRSMDDIYKNQAFRDLVDKLAGEGDPAKNRKAIEDYLGQTITEPLVVKYDNGDLIKMGDHEYVPVDPKTYQSDVFIVPSISITQEGSILHVRVPLQNQGILESLPGEVHVWCLVPTTGGTIGHAMVPVSPVGVGQSVIIDAYVQPAPTPPTFLAIELHLEDADKTNNHAWRMYGLGTYGTVAGMVTLQGAPWSGARVGCAGNLACTITDSDGHYSLFLPTGPLTFLTARVGKYSQSAPINVIPGGTTPQDFAFSYPNLLANPGFEIPGDGTGVDAPPWLNGYWGGSAVATGDMPRTGVRGVSMTCGGSPYNAVIQESLPVTSTGNYQYTYRAWVKRPAGVTGDTAGIRYLWNGTGGGCTEVPLTSDDWTLVTAGPFVPPPGTTNTSFMAVVVDANSSHVAYIDDCELEEALVPDNNRLSDVRSMPEGFPAAVFGKTVTASEGSLGIGVAYVEEADRSSGIRIQGLPAPLTVGDTVGIRGTVGVTPGGEKHIQWGATYLSTAGMALRPLGANGRSLGQDLMTGLFSRSAGWLTMLGGDSFFDDGSGPIKIVGPTEYGFQAVNVIVSKDDTGLPVLIVVP